MDNNIKVTNSEAKTISYAGTKTPDDFFTKLDYQDFDFATLFASGTICIHCKK